MNKYVGIDVGAKTVVVSRRAQGRTIKTETVAQTAAGHAKLVKQLGALQPACIVLEATGVYHLDLAVALRGGRQRCELAVRLNERVFF